MTSPEPPSDGRWAPPGTPPGTPTAAPSQPGESRRRGSGLLIALSIACGVLLLATVALGATAVWLGSDRASLAAERAKAEADAKAEREKSAGVSYRLGDVELLTFSDLEFGSFAITEMDESGFSSIYSVIENPDAKQAAEVYFDVTAYAEDGTVIDRTPSNMYLLPGQKSLFQGIFTTDLSEAESFKIEQTSIEFDAPIMAGGISVDALASDGESYVEGEFTSTLDQVPEYPDLYVVGFIGDEIFAVCSDSPDIPANGAFTASCRLDYMVGTEPAKSKKLPKDATFDAFVELQIPY